MPANGWSRPAIVLSSVLLPEPFGPMTASSDPVAIYQVFGMSKKQFKKGLGTLLKKRRVSISHVKVTLLPPAP